MLAEKRVKKKWSLNPRGSFWSTDQNKFGQRILEKMGWKVGSGLGVNLQGSAEHIRVSVKNDVKGLGFKARAENLLEHQNSFSKLLAELNGGVTEEVKVRSLEQQSQKSRARLHYQKFTRGKDLSQCSDKDLQCILGCNTKDEVGQASFYDRENNDFDVMIVDGGNKDDFFKQIICDKFESKREKSKKKKCEKFKNSDSVIETKDESCTGAIDDGESCGAAAALLEENKINETSCEPLQVKNSKLDRREKKKRKVIETVHSECELQEGKIKIKKKKNKACDSITFSEDDLLLIREAEKNNDFEDKPISETCNKNHALDDNEICDVTVGKKKNKKKKREEKEKKCEVSTEEQVKAKDIYVESTTIKINSRVPVSDCAFKGSNIMYIKGYGVE